MSYDLNSSNMKVNWDDEKPNINGKIKLMFQTTNQWFTRTNKPDTTGYIWPIISVMFGIGIHSGDKKQLAMNHGWPMAQ